MRSSNKKQMMNAKNLILGLILLVSVPVNLFSAEFTDKDKNEDDNGWRSMSSPIFLSVENNTIYIYSAKQLDNLCLQIKDQAGAILYSDRINIQPESEYSLSLAAIPAGDYQIILTQGANYLIENFTKQ